MDLTCQWRFENLFCSFTDHLLPTIHRSNARICQRRSLSSANR